MIQIVKYIIGKLQFLYADIFHKDAIKLFWHRGKSNFGDVLNPLLIEKITGKQVVWVYPKFSTKKNYIAIGSILESASSSTVVWGAGFISKAGHCHKTPLKVCAVRGPLTRDKLLQDGIDCPEIYGDPALLLPKIYNPSIEKKFELGIIPHFVDKDNIWLRNIQNNTEIKILDIQESNPYDLIDQLLSCKKIASSSLHGIIVADAYSIPSLWIDLSDQVIGDGFKFLDYFASVKRKDVDPFKIDLDTNVKSIYENFYNYKIDIDIDALIDAFPLDLKDEYIGKLCG